MTRTIRKRIDALFVEGPDDGAVVNALVWRHLGLDIAAPRLVRAEENGGGWNWALDQFDRTIREAHDGARIGLVIDRDGVDGRDDNWPRIAAQLKKLQVEAARPLAEGHVLGGRVGIWMWPDNVTPGDLENFVRGIVPESVLLDYAEETSRYAKANHGAEYEAAHAQKAALKVRSIWRDASAAGGYGHLVRNLPLVNSPASNAFLTWFQTLFLAD